MSMAHLPAVVVIIAWIIPCYQIALAFETKASEVEEDWQSGTATWYGAPNGDGSEGGACGYGSLVGQMPLSSRVAAGSPDIFKGGKACGACYQVKCTEKDVCWERAVDVVITDECPGGICASGKPHLDLSGTAFSNMAPPTRASDLLNAGIVPILIRRVPCNYLGKKIAFHVDEGSSANWFSVLIEYEDGDGDLQAVDLKQAKWNEWQGMKQTWGANWCVDGGGPLEAPFSIRLKSLSSGRTLTAESVIPQNWKPNTTYRSLVNFD